MWNFARNILLQGNGGHKEMKGEAAGCAASPTSIKEQSVFPQALCAWKQVQPGEHHEMNQFHCPSIDFGGVTPVESRQTWPHTWFCYGGVWLFRCWQLWWERSISIAHLSVIQMKFSVIQICQWDPQCMLCVERAAEMGFVLNTGGILYLLKPGQNNEHSSVNEIDELLLRRKRLGCAGPTLWHWGSYSKKDSPGRRQWDLWTFPLL